MHRALILAGLVLGAGLAAPALAAVEVPLRLAEPGDGGRPVAGIARLAEPVTSGVPLPPGTQQRDWSLWDGSRELPLQVAPLGGETPWLLLDFQVDLPALGAKTLTLREGRGSATAAHPAMISNLDRTMARATWAVMAAE